MATLEQRIAALEARKLKLNPSHESLTPSEAYFAMLDDWSPSRPIRASGPMMTPEEAYRFLHAVTEIAD